MKILHCTSVGCKCCKKAIRLEKSIFGKQMYVCEHNTKKHESIDGWHCEHFKCDYRGEYSICDSCRG